ncbi:MAG: hypothetical protein J5672_01545 [Verrucomicrobia bacterium]|nr:hypothetical protein [Verrucomicrobiota bacterium]
MSAIEKQIEIQVLQGENFAAEKVNIKLIMPFEFEKYMKINVLNDFELIKANTGLTEEQIGRIHPDSINDLVEQIKILNANGFYKYLRGNIDKTLQYMSDFDESKLRTLGYIKEKGLMK